MWLSCRYRQKISSGKRITSQFFPERVSTWTTASKIQYGVSYFVELNRGQKLRKSICTQLRVAIHAIVKQAVSLMGTLDHDEVIDMSLW